MPARDSALDFVLAEAKRHAGSAYVPQRGTMPASLDKLGPDQYRSIRFNPDVAIWRTDGLPFRIDLLPVGFNFQTTVTVSVIENSKVQDLVATPDMFEFGPNVPPPPPKASLPLSGFRIRNPINSPKIWDEFLVFQGASYFRALAQQQVYGLSGRGLALNTAEPSGEEFPAFTHFWIERPDKTPRKSPFMRCSRAHRRPAPIALGCVRASRPRWRSI